MSISATRLKRRINETGVSKDELARAVQREGLTGRKALAAVGHWLNGSSLRPCKGRDVAAIAEALGCEPNDLRRFEAEHRFARISPRKAALIVDTIRGKDYVEAWALLQMSKHRAAVFVRQVLEAAVANAEDTNQGSLDRRNLRVAEARVSPGPTIKRIQPKDRGRAHPILKRNSHIFIAVEAK